MGLTAKRLWILATAEQLRNMPTVVNPKHVESLKLTNNWYYTGFLRRNHLSILRSSNRKQADVSNAKVTIFKIHADLQARLKKLPTLILSSVIFKSEIYSILIKFRYHSCVTATAEPFMIRAQSESGAASLVRVSKKGRRQCTLQYVLMMMPCSPNRSSFSEGMEETFCDCRKWRNAIRASMFFFRILHGLRHRWRWILSHFMNRMVHSKKNVNTFCYATILIPKLPNCSPYQ